jgi:hypothetical protein
VKRGYKVWATDEQIITAMRDSLKQRGKISRDFVCVQCRCGSKRVNKIAEELGLSKAREGGKAIRHTKGRQYVYPCVPRSSPRRRLR